MIIQEIELELFADYFQFYLQDELADENLSDAWKESAVENLIALADGTIGIETVRNVNVPVSIQVLDSEPEIDLESTQIDQINECDIEVNSGKLVIAGCTEYFPEAQRINLGKGIYRARIHYNNLDKLSEDGLEGEDHYIIQLWKVNDKKGKP